MPRPPDPNALRRDRNDDPTWPRLTPRDPAAAVPDFPLADPTPRVLHWWEHFWGMPQANQWEKGREHVTVAIFCQVLAEAEKPTAPVTIHRPLKSLRDELGLSIDGMRRRRWVMPDENVAAVPPATVTPLRSVQPRRQTSRDRVKRVAPAEQADADRPPF
jgi:hypothetical protein